MDKINCISEALGVIDPLVIFEYIEKNWRNINYTETINNMMQKFKNSLINADDDDKEKRWRYNELAHIWYKRADHGDSVNGHLKSCAGAGGCRCCLVLFTHPREFIARIISAYTPSHCLVEQMMNGSRIESVLKLFRQNCWKMDMKDEMKKLLALLKRNIKPDEYARLRDIFVQQHKSPTVRICTGFCKQYFYHGMSTCSCVAEYEYKAPQKFIEDLVVAYYKRRISAKQFPCHICENDFDDSSSLDNHFKKDHYWCDQCSLYVVSELHHSRSSYHLHAIETDTESESDSSGYDEVDF